jgi:NAD dependent epimerase/dehydratase family enzyme
MQLPFKLGLGSRLGDGRQIMSWIHRHDYLNALLFLLDDPECRGAFNLTAPTPVSNRVFTATLAHSLQRKAFLVTPEWALKPVLGERSLLLFAGQCDLPAVLLSHGVAIRFPTMADSLESAGVN